MRAVFVALHILSKRLESKRGGIINHCIIGDVNFVETRPLLISCNSTFGNLDQISLCSIYQA